MSDLCADIKDLLVTKGIGTFAAVKGWGIHVGKLPLEGESVISIMDAGGLTPSPKWLLDYPAIQIRVRGPVNGYQGAKQKARDIKDVLLGLPSQNVGDNRIVIVNMLGDITNLGFDDQNRVVLALNFQLTVEPNTTVLSNRLPL